MELTEAQYNRIASCLPVPRGNVTVSNLQVLNAFLYMAEQGCQWRALPEEQFGPWNTVYRRLNRWAKKGVLDQVFALLQEEGLLRIKLEVAGLDSTIVPVHPDGTGAQNKTDPRPSAAPAGAGPPRFTWLPRMNARW